MTRTADSQTGNWGRWGADDERGALNLLTPEVVLAATRLCRTGKVYNLGLPVARAGGPVLDFRPAPQRLTLTSPSDGNRNAWVGEPEGQGSSEDVLVIASHNGTHMDALCHVYAEDRIYNGFAAGEFASHNGAPRCGIEKTGGFAGRAVVLDVAGHLGLDWLEQGYAVSADDLEACRAAHGVTLGAGDILLVRTGWLDHFAHATANLEPPPWMQPGLGLSAIDFVADHDLAVVGSDNSAVEVIPFETSFIPVHVALLVERGITLLEHLVLTQLAADGVRECLLAVGPLLVTGATGSPVNPIAIA